MPGGSKTRHLKNIASVEGGLEFATSMRSPFHPTHTSFPNTFISLQLTPPIKAGRNSKYSPQKLELLSEFSNEYRLLRQSSLVKGVRDTKCSDLFRRATSVVINVFGYHLMTYPTNEEINAMSPEDRITGGYHDPQADTKDEGEAIIEDDDTNTTETLSILDRKKKKKFDCQLQSNVLKGISRGKKIKLTNAQKTASHKRIHGVCMEIKRI
jgi:hypothetical protein